MLISDPIAPMAVRTGEQYRRAAQLTTAMSSRAATVLVCGTSGRALVRDLTAHLLTASGRSAVCGLAEAASHVRDLRDGDRIVADWIPTDGTRFEGAPALVGIAACRADELPAGWNRQAHAAAIARLVQLARVAVVANGSDPVAVGLAATSRAPAYVTGGIDRNPPAELRNGQLVLREPDTGSRGVVPIADLGFVGPSQLESALVAISLALLAGVRIEAIAAGLKGFRPGRDRPAEVARRRGTTWLMATDATTPGEAARAVEAVGRPAMLIAGGRYGGQPLDRWRRALGAVRCVLLFGPAGDTLAAAAQGMATVVRCADVDDAVGAATHLSHRGDAILLAPACEPGRNEHQSLEDRYLDALDAGVELRGEAA